MRFSRRLLLVPALAVGLAAGGLTATEGAAQQSMTIQLNEENDSGVSGTAMLMPMGSGTQVEVQLQGSPGGPHPIHIHRGNCGPTLDPTPLVNLTPVQNGSSVTMVELTADQIMAAAHAINVHKSREEASVYIACGDLSTGAGPAETSPPPPVGVPVAAQPKPAASPAPKPAAPAAKPAAPAPSPAAAKPAGAPAQAPRALPRTGEAENWMFVGMALAGAVLLGAGMLARRRGLS